MREFNYTMRKALAVGLRSTDKNKRGHQALVKSDGAYPYESALSSVEALDRINIDSISPVPTFPYPQVFELKQLTILCTATQIYSYADDTLTLEISSLTEGHLWSVADFGNFIALVNGKQVVYRDGVTKIFTSIDEIGIGSASGICNLNGQIILAAPGVEITEVPEFPFHVPLPANNTITLTGYAPVVDDGS